MAADEKIDVAGNMRNKLGAKIHIATEMDAILQGVFDDLLPDLGFELTTAEDFHRERNLHHFQPGGHKGQMIRPFHTNEPARKGQPQRHAALHFPQARLKHLFRYEHVLRDTGIKIEERIWADVFIGFVAVGVPLHCTPAEAWSMR